MSSVIKAIYIKDLGVYSFKLPRGSYMVDDEPINIEAYPPELIQSKSISNIRRVLATSMTCRYESAEGEIKTVSEYDFEISLLKEDLTFDDDGYISSNDLDAEYAYKKYKKSWVAIRRTVNETGEPILFEVEHEIQLDTGNAFVTPLFSAGGADINSLYTFRRSAHALSVLSNVFKELGVYYDEGADYRKTKNKKIWSNSNHASCEFVVAFGGYLQFMRVYGQSKNSFRGTLDRCIGMANADAIAIEREARAGYAMHFNSGASVSVSEIKSDLASIESGLMRVDSKQKTQPELRQCLTQIRETIRKLTDQLAAQS